MDLHIIQLKLYSHGSNVSTERLVVFERLFSVSSRSCHSNVPVSC